MKYPVMKPIVIKAFSLLLLSAILAACAPIDYSSRLDLLGDPAPVSAATRTIVITPDTEYVNITGGEIIRFVVNDKSFAWSFNVDGYGAPYDLNLVAPSGILTQKVKVYLAPNPMYLRDGRMFGGMHLHHRGH